MNEPSRLTSLRGAVLLPSLLLASCTQGPTPGGATGIVQKKDLVQRVTVAGTVIPSKRTVLMPPYQGYVKKIYVKVGDEVKAGEPVISVTQSLSSASEIYPMRAPFAGRVMQVFRTEGEWVDDKAASDSNNNVMVRIDDISRLYVAGDAPEIDMVKIKVGQSAVIKAAAILARDYHGIVREISLAAREKKDWYRANEKVEFPLRIEVKDQDEQLKPGMSVLIDVIAAEHDHVLTLGHEYIQKTGDKYFVTLEGGKRQDVEVGLQNEEAFEITKGLAEGDRVRPADFAAQAASPQGS